MKKLLIILLCLFISGCATLGEWTEEDNERFEREKERHQKDPYLPNPRNLK